MTNKDEKIPHMRERISFEKLLELHKTNVIDAHMVDIYVDPYQLFSQLGWFARGHRAQASPQQPEADVSNIASPLIEELPSSVIRVHWKKVKTMIACSDGSLRRGSVKGIKWIGGSATRKAQCEIDLNHPTLSRLGLTKSHFTKGEKMFYTSKEVQKLFGFKTQGPVLNRFDNSDLLWVGTSRRFPVALTKAKIEARLEWQGGSLPEVLAFPKEVTNEG